MPVQSKRSAGIEMHSPCSDSRAAVASQASALRERNVGLDAVGDVALGDHFADAARAAGDQCDLA